MNFELLNQIVKYKMVACTPQWGNPMKNYWKSLGRKSQPINEMVQEFL